jgi:uncharacterized cupredoxin-like copper-binding protein
MVNTTDVSGRSGNITFGSVRMVHQKQQRGHTFGEYRQRLLSRAVYRTVPSVAEEMRLMTDETMFGTIAGSPIRQISRRRLFRGAAVAGISASGFAVAARKQTASTFAQGSPVPTTDQIAWEAYLQAGTCDVPDTSTRMRLGDPVYGIPVGVEASPADESDQPVIFQPVGPPPLLPVLTGTATIPMALEALYTTPHHVVIESLNLVTNQRALLACGNVNGVLTVDELLFGLQAVLADTSGIVWMRSNGESQTTATVFVTQGLAAGGHGMMNTPAAGVSPTVVAEATEVDVAETAQATDAQAATEFEVGSYDIYFEPNELTVSANTDVTILLPNYGMTVHNFSINDRKNPDVANLGVDVDLNPGDNKTITINAPAGDYYFYCNVPGHEAAGMWGYLHVV